MCVSQDAFEQVNVPKDSEPGELEAAEGQLPLDGAMASVVVSKGDGLTPVEVKMFDVEARISADGAGGASDTGEKRWQSKKCTDCLDLETDAFAKGTDLLRMQTTLLTTGAVAGILWLLITSG